MSIDRIVEAIKEMVATQQEEFEMLWEINTVGIDIESFQFRQCEEIIMAGQYTEDLRGSPGQRGRLSITNLRIIWKLAADPSMNITIGYDTILLAEIKTIPTSKSEDKHRLILKTTKNGKKLQFHFQGYTQRQLSCYHKIIDLHKQYMNTKEYRYLSNKMNSNGNWVLEGQEIKAEYQKGWVVYDNRENQCRIMLTNVRVVMLGMNDENWGIPWIIISYIEDRQVDGRVDIKITLGESLRYRYYLVRGYNHTETSKMLQQLKFFREAYSKTPNLGASSNNNQISYIQNRETTISEQKQIEDSKINLFNRDKIYKQNSKRGSIKETEYNPEIGLMMQNFPYGKGRQDLWAVIK